MTKRIGYVFVVFYFKYTPGMILSLMHIYLAELLAVFHKLPFLCSYHTKMEVFNGVFAYVFLNIIQIFNQQHPHDFSEADRAVELSQEAESDLFLSPLDKQSLGWVTVGILFMYLAIHLTLFAKVLMTDIKSCCRARCCKAKPKQPEIPTLSANEVAPGAEQAPAETVLSKKLSKKQKKRNERDEQVNREILSLA